MPRPPRWWRRQGDGQLVFVLGDARRCRFGQPTRRAARARTAGLDKEFVTPEVMISNGPPRSETEPCPAWMRRWTTARSRLQPATASGPPVPFVTPIHHSAALSVGEADRGVDEHLDGVVSAVRLPLEVELVGLERGRALPHRRSGRGCRGVRRSREAPIWFLRVWRLRQLSGFCPTQPNRDRGGLSTTVTTVTGEPANRRTGEPPSPANRRTGVPVPRCPPVPRSRLVSQQLGPRPSLFVAARTWRTSRPLPSAPLTLPAQRALLSAHANSYAE